MTIEELQRAIADAPTVERRQELQRELADAVERQRRRDAAERAT